MLWAPVKHRARRFAAQSALESTSMSYLSRCLSGLVCALSLATPVALAAGQSAVADADVAGAARRHTAQALEWRHQIHAHPELGNREHETAKLVADHLKTLGMEVSTGIAQTGVLGVLRGGKPGPVVAVRADMDALPVTEDTNLPFKSEVRATYNGLEVGVMHACGHDIHTAVQLGVASILADLRDEIPGTVLFIFQPAEEGPPPGEEGGAELMLREGAFADPRPKAVFGLHTLANLDVGKIGFTVGPALAAVDHFKAVVMGRQTHGAQPHEGIDPVVIAAQVITAFQTIASRSVNPIEPVVVTVGMVRGGERYNIIPAAVKLEGTVRTYDAGVRNDVQRRMDEILDGLTRAGGGSYSFEYERGTPATINDAELASQMLPTVEALPVELVKLPPTMGGEDFAYFANEVPGFFYRLGTLKPGTQSGPHHSPTFRADDDSIAIGMRVMANLLLDYLHAAAQK